MFLVVKLKSLNYSLRNVSIAGDYGYVPLIAVKTTRPFLINDLLPDFNIINTTNVANGTANDNTSGASEFSAELRHLHFLCIVFYGQMFFFSSISFCHFYCLSLFDFRLL